MEFPGFPVQIKTLFLRGDHTNRRLWYVEKKHYKSFVMITCNVSDDLVIFSHGTKLSKRGQISVPSEVRKKLHIGRTRLEWVVEAHARVIPVPADPIRAFRGSGKKGLV